MSPLDLHLLDQLIESLLLRFFNGLPCEYGPPEIGIVRKSACPLNDTDERLFLSELITSGKKNFAADGDCPFLLPLRDFFYGDRIQGSQFEVLGWVICESQLYIEVEKRSFLFLACNDVLSHQLGLIQESGTLESRIQQRNPVLTQVIRRC